MPSLNLTQFGITNALGALSRGPQPATFSARIDPGSSETIIQVGCAVKLVGYANDGAEIIVDVVDAQSEGLPFGVIFLNTKKNTYAPGDVVELACAGNTLWLAAYAAITRGATVAITVDSNGEPAVVTDATSAHNILGVALSQPAAAGELVLVQIAPRLLP